MSAIISNFVFSPGRLQPPSSPDNGADKYTPTPSSSASRQSKRAWVLSALCGLFTMLLQPAANAAPIGDLIYPQDCAPHWDVGNLTERYFIKGPAIKGEYVLACFNTTPALTPIAGPALDDMHIRVTSPNGGRLVIGPPGFQVEINDIPQTLGTGNLAGESFHFDANADILLVRHDGIPLDLPFLVGLLGANVCVNFSDNGVALPPNAPCPQIGDPPLPQQPPVDPFDPDDVANPFRVFARAEDFSTFSGLFISEIPEPSSAYLMGMAMFALLAKRHARRRV